MSVVALPVAETAARAAAGPDPDRLDADRTRHPLDPFRWRVLTKSTSVVVLTVYFVYLVYRGLYTINPEALVFSLLVYAAEIHGFVALFFYLHQVWTRQGRVVPAPAEGQSVDVFITTYNEDVDLLRQTVRGAIAMRYPHRTYILDDGRRDEVRALAEALGCGYITRPDNRDAKAGNWNNAFAQTTGELIATFDADHIPRPSFLERTLGFFRDPDVALVQVPQQYHNLDSVQHRVDWRARRMYGEQDVFFNLVMPGKDRWNAAFFCGTGAVLRRRALEPHGGILTGTVTEDLHTSMVLHSEGWKSVYLNEVLVTGLAPMDLRSFEVQRLRWAEGNLAIARYINPLTAPNLTVHQRLAYLASLFHWTMGVPKLIFYLAPPWMLMSGTFPIANFGVQFVLVYLAFLLTLVAGYRLVSRHTGRLMMDELFNMVSFFTLIRALKRVVAGRGRTGRFEVTDKRGSGQAAGREVLPHFALLGFSLLAMSWSLMGLGFGVSDDVFGAGVAGFWTCYNLVLVAMVIRMGMRRPQERRACRFRAAFPVEVVDRVDQHGVAGLTADLSEHGCTLLWPTPLAQGTALTLRLHFGDRATLRSAAVVAPHGPRGGAWVAHGVRFTGITQAEIDELHDAIFALVVPHLFGSLTEPGWVTRLWRRLTVLASRQRRQRAARRPLLVPVRVTDDRGTFMATARDISPSGLSLSAPRAATPGTTVDIEVLAPGHGWRGSVSVARAAAAAGAGPGAGWVWGLRFDRERDRQDIEQLELWTAA